jgi:hypothetical protein
MLLGLLLLAAPAGAADDWGPWEAPPETAAAAADGVDYDPLKAGVRFFQRYISPVDGPRCPMLPTCSAYALQALDRHGPFFGTLLTVDRLLHETDPREHRHPVRVGGRVRFADPLANNDFWLAEP